MLRIWSWNVNGQHLWDRLATSEVDVALLQESPVPVGPWEGKVAPHPEAGWGTAGWLKPLGTAAVSGTYLRRRVGAPVVFGSLGHADRCAFAPGHRRRRSEYIASVRRTRGLVLGGPVRHGVRPRRGDGAALRGAAGASREASESVAGGVAGRFAECPDLSHLPAGSDGCDTSTRLCLRIARVGGPAFRACPQYRSR